MERRQKIERRRENIPNTRSEIRNVASGNQQIRNTNQTRRIPEKSIRPEKNTNIKGNNTNNSSNEIVDLPIIILEDDHYEKVKNFIKNSTNNNINKNDTRNESNNIISQEDDPKQFSFLCDALIKPKNSLKNKSDRSISSSNEATLFAETSTNNNVKIYTQKEKEEIIKNFQKLFNRNFKDEVNKMIKKIYKIISNYIKTRLNKHSLFIKNQSNYPSLFISKDDTMNYYDLQEILTTIQSDNILRNIIYFNKNKNLSEIHNEFEILENELNCLLFICNSENTLKNLFDEIKNLNEEKIIYKYDLILEEDIAISALEFIKKNNFFGYCSNIIVKVNDKKSIKDEFDTKYSDNINEFLSEINEIVVYFKKKEAEKGMPINEPITLNKYDNNYYKFHEKISEYYGKFTRELYDNFINDLKNDDMIDDQLISNIQILYEKSKKTLKIIEYLKNNQEKNGILEKVNLIFNNLSYYQDLFDKLILIISDIVYCLNDYNINFNKGLKNDCELYTSTKMTFSELLSYQQNIKNVIVFPAFTKVYTNKSLALNNNSSEKKISVSFKIIYDYKNGQIPTCIHLDYEKKLFLPFSFFEIKEVNFQNNNNAEILLKVVNKEQILEEYLNENNKLKYNDIKEIIEIKKVKNVLIYDPDKENELYDLYRMYQFIELEIDGTFLIANNMEYFKLLLDQIKSQNQEKLIITFELIIFDQNPTEILNLVHNNDNKKFFNNIILIANENEYKTEMDNKLIDTIVSTKRDLIKFLKSTKCTGSFFPMKLCELITFEKYERKFSKFHEIISKYYQKISVSNDYSSTAMDIIEGLISKVNDTINIKHNKLMRSLKKFIKNYNKDIDRYKEIIRVYTDNDNSFFQNFNKWLRDLDDKIYEKIAFFVSNLILSLNEYGDIEEKGLKGEHILYRGLNMTFADLLLYKQNKNNIIVFPSFTSTTNDKKVIENFNSNKNSTLYSIEIIIKYNCTEEQIPTGIDISDLSKYDEKEILLLPFSFFEIENVEIDPNKLKGKIFLNIVSKEEILETKIDENNVVNYNIKKKIIETSNNKIITYNIDDIKNKTNIFGEDFIKNNKDNIELIIEGEKHELCKNYTFKQYGINKVEIIEKNKINNFSFMFRDCSSLSSINSLKNWDMSAAINMGCMFMNCISLTSIDALKKWNILNVKILSGIFMNCVSLSSISAIKNWNFSNIETMSSMFRDCSGLNEIDAVKNWDIKNVNNMNGLFYNCLSLERIDSVKNWDVSNVKNMSFMFYNCEFLEDIEPLKKWNVSKVENTSFMFHNCNSIKSIEPLKNWDMSNVTNMSFMFYNCNSLKSIEAVENWNLSKCNNLSGMFRDCTSLESIDPIEKWNVANVKNMNCMFMNCTSLKCIEPINNWNIDNVKNMDGMFCNCTSLKINNNNNLKKQDTNNENNNNIIKTGVEVVGEGLKQGTSLVFSPLKKLSNQINTIVNNPFKNLAKKNSSIKCPLSGPINVPVNKTMAIPKKRAKIEPQEKQITKTKTRGEKNDDKNEDKNDEKNDNKNNDKKNNKRASLKYFTSFKNIFDNNINMVQNLFKNPFSLPFVSSFKNWNVKNDSIINLHKNTFIHLNDPEMKLFPFSTIFLKKNMLTDKKKENKKNNNLKNNNSSNNKEIIYNIDNIKWKTKIFGNDFVIRNKNKIKLKINEEIIDLCMEYKFKLKGENKIEIIENEKIKNMDFMFDGCISLITLKNFEKWDVTNVNSMFKMFGDCNSIISIDNLEKWNVSNVKYMGYMFFNCYAIKNIKCLEKWKFKENVETKGMFGGMNKEVIETIPDNFKEFNSLY